MGKKKTVFGYTPIYRPKRKAAEVKFTLSYTNTQFQNKHHVSMITKVLKQRHLK